MFKKHVTAGAAVAALVLSGLGAGVATPAFAEGAHRIREVQVST